MEKFSILSKSSLQALSEPIADRFNLVTLPKHAHQIVYSSLCYFIIDFVLAPRLSSWFVPKIYGQLKQSTRIHWNIRIVSFVQATFICTCAFYVIFSDKTRQHMDADDRLWTYSPAIGRIQAFVAGYFIWDLFVSLWYYKILGPGSLAHGISAMVITMMGFRPFANYYGVNFILYELSTPFLNIHWVLDKIGMTGTTLQLVNGIILMSSFFGCRIVWGFYQSYNLYRDAWTAWENSTTLKCINPFEPGTFDYATNRCQPQVTWWIVISFVVANSLLSALNLYWFGLMIDAMRRRFQKPKEKAS